MGKIQMVRGRVQGVFVSSTSGNNDLAHFTALHSTSMPARQLVDAGPGKGMNIQAC